MITHDAFRILTLTLYTFSSTFHEEMNQLLHDNMRK